MQMNAKLLDILRGERKQIAQLTLKRSKYAICFVRLWAFRQARWSAPPTAGIWAADVR